MADETESGSEGGSEGWSPVPGVDGRVDHIEFDTLDFLDELSHPIRARIMRQLKDPNTIADLARSLDMPVTRLYHHVNRLEQAGLIHVVATRKVAAVTERRYQAAARSMGVAQKFYDSHDPAQVATALGSIFDMAKLGLQQQIEAGALSFDDDDTTLLSFGHLTLSAEGMVQLHERLTNLIEEFTTGPLGAAPDGTKVSLFVAAYPETD